jgi:hypothetical protein
VLAAARADAERLMETGREETTALRRDAQVRAAAEADAVLARGREEIVDLQRLEEARLRIELHAMVTQALFRMIGPADDAAVRLVVARVLEAAAAR